MYYYLIKQLDIMEIKHRFTGDIIHSGEFENVMQCVLYCIKNGISLRGANLRGADLQDAYLQDANLRGADLQDADLQDAYLRGANLRGANLRGADLQDADLQDANLRGADLQDANLRGADLRGAYLQGAKSIITFNKMRGRICYAIVKEKSLIIKAGCFWGDLSAFEKKCKETYPDNPVEAYEAQIQYLKAIEATLK